MASATDIITYIGVPLAVLGVFPLIWNMFASLLIWNRLRSSLCKNAKPLFDFRIDPVAGIVATSFYGATLTVSDLNEGLPHLDLHTQTVACPENYLLGATWMSLLDLRLPIKSRDRRYAQRFLVDTTMKTDFFGLKLDWASFVYLALALGVSADDPGFCDIKRSLSHDVYPAKRVTLCSVHGEVIGVTFAEGVPVAELLGRELKFSLQRALAWDLVMVTAENQGQSRLVPLMGPGGSLLSGNSTEEFSLGLFNNPQREAAFALKPVEAALIWSLYVEETLHSSNSPPGEILPVAQDVLKVRQDAILELRRLQNLEQRLESVFPLNWELREKLASILGPVPQHTEDMYLDTMWPLLQNNATFQDIRDNFSPSLQYRVRNDADLNDLSTPMALLARIFLATSVVQKWKQEDWDTESGQ
ncbi:hypothetical protein AOQ84DRAFT_227156 [Glonium stellatum]|uniref:Uncharacterized protein n=1 Tax=Glonium stellatum TaxID=574774 RepID=A0A8E2JX05_9PEZI|nr:hypothetical protein AOQ84DRAFT_227156 [Glonium stellatum]